MQFTEKVFHDKEFLYTFAVSIKDLKKWELKIFGI